MYHPIGNNNATSSIELGPVSPITAPHTPRPSLGAADPTSTLPSQASSNQPNASISRASTVGAGNAPRSVTPTTSQSNTSALVSSPVPRPRSELVSKFFDKERRFSKNNIMFVKHQREEKGSYTTTLDLYRDENNNLQVSFHCLVTSSRG